MVLQVGNDAFSCISGYCQFIFIRVDCKNLDSRMNKCQQQRHLSVPTILNHDIFRLGLVDKIGVIIIFFEIPLNFL